MKNFLPFLLFIAFTLSNASAQSSNFSENIALILYDHCTTCHRPGNIGPFPLLTYEDAASQAYSIQSAVNSSIMPPWPPNPEYRHFKNELVLSQSQIDQINDWVDAGAPQGDSTLAPPQPVFPVGSLLGTPDMVMPMMQPHVTAGNGLDEYYFFVLHTNLTEDRAIKGIEFIPGNAKAVHHGIFYVDTTGTAAAMDDTTAEYGIKAQGTGPIFPVAEDVGGWAPPGLNQSFFPAGIGRMLWKNCDIVIGLHYAPTDSIYSDQSTINIFFADNDSLRILQNDAVWEFYLTEPPLKIYENTVETFEEVFPVMQDISIYDVAPHAHLLCKQVTAYALTPDLDTVHLISCDYDFHWQYQYVNQMLLKIPAGSVIHVFGTYDNTVNNPDNPNDPPITVSRGESTTDEMMLFYFNYLPYEPGDEYFIIDSSLIATGNSSLVPKVTETEYPVMPNPASDHFVTMVKSDLPPRAQLFDLSGKQLPVAFEITGQNNVWRIRGASGLLTSGMYLLRIDADGNQNNRKVMISR